MAWEALEEGLASHESKLKEMNDVFDSLDKRVGKLKAKRAGSRTKCGKDIPPDALCRPWDSKRAFVKWAGPCFLVGCCGYVGSAGLHIASYNFVHEMNSWNHTVVDGAFSTEADRSMAHDVMENFSSIPDPIESNFLGPRVNIRMQILDRMALAFPVLFSLLAIYTRRAEVWTKVMICTALLAACKGIIGALTTVPDSSGWEVCRDQHLGPEGYAFLSQDLSFFQIVTVDFWWFPHYHRPLRYCSDMMFSGHTFFVTLYALGLYEVALIYTSSWHHKIETRPRGRVAFLRACTLALISLAAIGQQVGEIYFVLLSRFHYSSDVLVALLLTFLFYTNGGVCVAAKQWALRDVHLLTMGRGALRCALDSSKLMKWDDNTPAKLIDVDTPIWCCGTIAFANQPVANPPYAKKNDCADSRCLAREIDKFVSRGDVFVPWCCVPCCCLAGRQHIYSDKGIKKITEDQETTDILNGGGMHCGEGISRKDFIAAVEHLTPR